MIEGADRFGLAQLHQFRGRVGRGADQSYCLLLAEDPRDEARKRLELMEETTDGFRLAEADMQMRGPGQFFGTKQSGVPGLKVARLTDVKIIEMTRKEAERMLDADLGLTRRSMPRSTSACARCWIRWSTRSISRRVRKSRLCQTAPELAMPESVGRALLLASTNAAIPCTHEGRMPERIARGAGYQCDKLLGTDVRTMSYP